MDIFLGIFIIVGVMWFFYRLALWQSSNSSSNQYVNPAPQRRSSHSSRAYFISAQQARMQGDRDAETFFTMGMFEALAEEEREAESQSEDGWEEDYDWGGGSEDREYYDDYDHPDEDQEY